MWMHEADESVQVWGRDAYVSHRWLVLGPRIVLSFEASGDLLYQNWNRALCVSVLYALKDKVSPVSHSFSDNILLKTHERLHTEEKPYKMRFQQILFWNHTRVYTGEKQYESFPTALSQSGSLKTHRILWFVWSDILMPERSVFNKYSWNHTRVHTQKKPHEWFVWNSVLNEYSFEYIQSKLWGDIFCE